MLLLLSCALDQPAHDPERSRAFLVAAPTGDTGDAPEPEETVWAFVGQSNMCGQPRPNPYVHSIAAGGNHEGVRFIRNGIELVDYGLIPDGPDVVGPEAHAADELIQLGYLPESITLVTRCANGTNILYNRDTLIPLLIGDIETYGLPAPIGIMYWQGEADSRVLTLAQFYESRLLGTDGQWSLRDAVELEWPGIRWSVVELRVRDADYSPVAAQALVRSAQHLFGAYPRSCTIPSYDAPLLSGDNQPHVNQTGLEIIGRRSVHGWLDAVCP
jgi:hypothetical protein